MTDLLTGDLIRYVIAAEMAALIGVTVFLHTLYGDRLPRPLLVMGRGLLSVVGAVALAVIINAALPLALTPGSYAVALVALPATVGGVRLTVAAIRDTRSTHQEGTDR